MKRITVLVKAEVPVKYLKVEAGVRYWEDATVNGEEDSDGGLIPFRNGGCWSPVIDLETGTVENWPGGTVADVHYKVCDDGRYTLLNEDREVVKTIDGYVPDIMCPEESGYGDYIIMKIDGGGKISGWTVDLDDFCRKDD
jgi:hypothetical protein